MRIILRPCGRQRRACIDSRILSTTVASPCRTLQREITSKRSSPRVCTLVLFIVFVFGHFPFSPFPPFLLDHPHQTHTIFTLVSITRVKHHSGPYSNKPTSPLGNSILMTSQLYAPLCVSKTIGLQVTREPKVCDCI